MTMFREDECEGHLFCGKRCFKHQNKALNAAASKAKRRVPWYNDGPYHEINSMAVLIDWLTTEENYNRLLSGDKQNSHCKLMKCFK